MAGVYQAQLAPNTKSETSQHSLLEKQPVITCSLREYSVHPVDLSQDQYRRRMWVHFVTTKD